MTIQQIQTASHTSHTAQLDRLCLDSAIFPPVACNDSGFQRLRKTKQIQQDALTEKETHSRRINPQVHAAATQILDALISAFDGSESGVIRTSPTVVALYITPAIKAPAA